LRTVRCGGRVLREVESDSGDLPLQTDLHSRGEYRRKLVGGGVG
jgi:hypothetical protein